MFRKASNSSEGVFTKTGLCGIQYTKKLQSVK